MADAFLRRLAQLTAEGRIGEAAELSAEAVEQHPGDERILRARAILLRRSGRADLAEAFAAEQLERRPNAAWLHAQLGLAVQHRDPKRGIACFRRAHDLEPASRSNRLALIHALARWGDQGDDLEEAYQLLRPMLSSADRWAPGDLHIAFHVLKAVCAYDELDALGDPLDLARKWAEAGDHTALFLVLSAAKTPEARETLIELHRIAAAPMEALAAQKH